jgi:hypothetical protein
MPLFQVHEISEPQSLKVCWGPAAKLKEKESAFA